MTCTLVIKPVIMHPRFDQHQSDNKTWNVYMYILLQFMAVYTAALCNCRSQRHCPSYICAG